MQKIALHVICLVTFFACGLVRANTFNVGSSQTNRPSGWPQESICALALSGDYKQQIKSTWRKALSRLRHPEDRYFLNEYQGPGHLVDKKLREGLALNHDERFFVAGLTQAISRLPVFSGRCFRGITAKLNLFPGEVYTEKQFLSATLDLPRAENFAGKPGGHIIVIPARPLEATLFIIESINGRYIVDSVERHIIFPPGSQFKVIAREDIDPFRVVITLQEVQQP